MAVTGGSGSELKLSPRVWAWDLGVWVKVTWWINSV